ERDAKFGSRGGREQVYIIGCRYRATYDIVRTPLKAIYVPFSTERKGTNRQQLETSSLKIHFKSKRITAIPWKTTDGNVTSNRIDGTKISLSFGYLVSISFRFVPSEKSTLANFALLGASISHLVYVYLDWWLNSMTKSM
uniref:Uncharacterized protein n=1 Tax=Romanomermis culicivorax TaxID=13658 RepID=A0A915K7A5_ROMCU